jgi:hypothetical protein
MTLTFFRDLRDMKVARGAPEGGAIRFKLAPDDGASMH